MSRREGVNLFALFLAALLFIIGGLIVVGTVGYAVVTR